MSTIDKQLIDASKNGDYEKVKKLLENGADANTKNDDGDTPLHESARNSYTDIVRLLLENGAKQSDLFEKWNNNRIAKEFLEFPDCNPKTKHTDELCSESFEPVKPDDWYVVWEDDSVTIFENVHLISVEPELIKHVYVQC